MRVLVLGSQGQVARSLANMKRDSVDIVAVGRPELDLTKPETVDAAIAKASPDIVVNAAAYTFVDKAEQDREQAFAINGKGSGDAAAAAARAGLPFVHISTDYVFPGDGKTPYRENDTVGPLSVYGRSKLDGERAVAAANPNQVTLRTAWVYSPYGANFLKTMLRLAADRDVVRVVGDQVGTPTYAPDIADAILTICSKLLASRDDAKLRGTFHLVNEGVADWATFAADIFRQSAEKGGPSAKVEPITSAEYPTPVKRPGYSVLDTTRLRQAYGITMPGWQSGVTRCLDALLTKA